MKDFTQSLKFIVAFLFLTLIISMFAGQKMLYMFLVLVLIGMLLTNQQIISKIFGGLKYNDE